MNIGALVPTYHFPMRVNRRLLNVLALLVVAFSCQGCVPAQVVHLLMASSRSPHARGTWTGRLVYVTMRDRYHEGEYLAVAMDLETGPRVLRGAGGPIQVEPAHDLVLLVRGQGIIDPATLSVPDGSRVRVDGTLEQIVRPIRMVKRLGSDGGIMRGVELVSEQERERNKNLVINIGGRAKPEVLRSK